MYTNITKLKFDGETALKAEEVIKRKMDELYFMGNNVTQKDKGILELSYKIHKRGVKFLRVDPYKSHAVNF